MCSIDHRSFVPLVVALIMVSTVSGCATWIDRSTSDAAAKTIESKLLSASSHRRSVVLEVGFYSLPTDSLSDDRLASLWQWTDEMVIEPTRRHQLFDNGFRAGKVIRTDQFLSRLSELAAPIDELDVLLSQAEVASEVAQGMSQIPMRFGRRYELPLRKPRLGSHVTMVRLEHKTAGKTLQDPQYLFAVTPTQAASAGQVRLRLRPEIQHGAMRQKWVSSDAAIRLDNRRETWSLESLDIEFEGGTGDLFVIAGVQPSLGLGREMLTGNAVDHARQELFVLIRIKQIPEAAESSS